MGIYGNRFIEREVTLEDAIIQFESECDQYSKIFESISVLNESGIILEFSFKDIIEKIKDFFRMIGRKIKELWDKLFHKNQNIDDKINEANAIYDTWEKSDDVNDFEEDEEFDDNRDEDETEVSDKKDTEFIHKNKGDYKTKSGKYIDRFSYPRNPERFYCIKDIKFTSNGKSITKKIKIKLSKKKAKEVEVEYHEFPKEFKGDILGFPLDYITGLAEFEHQVAIWLNDKEENISTIATDENLEKTYNEIYNRKENDIQKYLNRISVPESKEMELKTASLLSAKEKIDKNLNEINSSIDHAKEYIDKLNNKELPKLIKEIEEFKFGETDENDKEFQPICKYFSKSANHDMNTLKEILSKFVKYLNYVESLKVIIVSDLEKITNMIATEVK